ncbi:MAG: hypothetical protein JO297_09650 [Nitrososphaeraceae archaeon]|nr:hypothetical protein [Nitrososphaeraceae archaeon]
MVSSDEEDKSLSLIVTIDIDHQIYLVEQQAKYNPFHLKTLLKTQL